ncbi:MAG: hypothetical protein J6Y78_01760 [Paludibacteraceae bacterium]|nr:hypothetical protein [Paludibacteraceae bacterium]
MKVNKAFIVFLSVILAFLLASVAPKLYDIYFNKPEIIEKTDTITKVDTFYVQKYHTDTVFKTKTIEKHHTDTLYKENGDTAVINLVHNSASNTAIMDGDTIKYSAYMTGRSYEGEEYPKMDSISFSLSAQKIKEVQTITIEKIIRQKGFRISPQVGVGYGMIQKKPDVYVGVGFSYIF